MPKEPSFENAIAFAAELIRIPGLSGRERDVAQRVLEEMQALGFSDVRADEVGNVIGLKPFYNNQSCVISRYEYGFDRT